MLLGFSRQFSATIKPRRFRRYNQLMGDTTTAKAPQLNYALLFRGMGLSQGQLITIDHAIQRAATIVGRILSHWTLLISLSLLAFPILAKTVFPWLLRSDPSAQDHRLKVLYAIKSTLMYCMGMLIVLTICQRHRIEYKSIIRAEHNRSWLNLFYLVIRLVIFQQVAVMFPTNHHANRLLAICLNYLWLSQQTVRRAIWLNLNSIVNGQLDFSAVFLCDQLTCMVKTTAALHHVLIPQLPWMAGLYLFLPFLVRVTQCFVAGSREQCLNAVRLLTILVGFALAAVDLPAYSRYFAVSGHLFSLYWDLFRDWKWVPRFWNTRDRKRDLPLSYFVISFVYIVIGRCIYLFVSWSAEARGLMEMSRRLVFNVCRLETEQVMRAKAKQQ